MTDQVLERSSGGTVSCSAVVSDSADRSSIRLESRLERCQEVHFSSDVFSADNSLVENCIAGRTPLVVLSPAVDRLYGPRIRSYFDGLAAPSHFLVLQRGERSKVIDGALEICERASVVGLRRTDPIVAIGGGVCSDICGVAAALHRRGTPHINVPTTLIGLVDAGIGTKNGVNHGGRKSALGSFHPPEHAILDRAFLATLPGWAIASGLAEVIKLATATDSRLFALVAESGASLVRTRFQDPGGAADTIIERSVRGMLVQLADNLFEIDNYRRRVDFGHTFSPYFETASAYSLTHGEAVALDIALSTEIARALGHIEDSEGEAILSLLELVGLELVWQNTSVSDLWQTLQAVLEHRNGDLHLVVPSSVGECTFVPMECITPQLLRACTDGLQCRPANAELGIP